MAGANLKIIRLPPDRWQEYKSLRLRALQDDPQAFGESYRQAQAIPDEKWRQRVVDARDEESSWLRFAEAGPNLVGMMGAFRSDESTATIFGVYVVPEVRGHGVAKELLAALVEDLSRKGTFTKLRLMVNREQTAAVKLYRGFGFQSVREESAELGDGKVHVEDVMERPLYLS